MSASSTTMPCDDILFLIGQEVNNIRQTAENKGRYSVVVGQFDTLLTGVAEAAEVSLSSILEGHDDEDEPDAGSGAGRYFLSSLENYHESAECTTENPYDAHDQLGGFDEYCLLGKWGQEGPSSGWLVREGSRAWDGLQTTPQYRTYRRIKDEIEDSFDIV